MAALQSERRGPVVVVVVLAAMGVVSTGCILFIDDDPSTLRVVTGGAVPYDPAGTVACLPPFMTGTTRTCVPCLAGRCASEFASCCGEPACRDAKQFQFTPLLAAIDDCETNKCGQECLGFECHSSAGICSCIAGSPLPSEEPCSASTVPGSLCCASIDWPQAGSCECSERDQCTQGLKLISHCYP